MSSQKLPKIFRKNKCFEFNKEELNEIIVKLKCIYCSIELTSQKPWLNLYEHVRAKTHKNNEINYRQEHGLEDKTNEEDDDQDIPSIFGNNQFTYTLEQIKCGEFMTECVNCKESILASKMDYWRGLYYHLKSKTHVEFMNKINQKNQHEKINMDTSREDEDTTSDYDELLTSPSQILIPKILRLKCFKFDVNDLNKDEYKVKCKCCSIEIIVNKHNSLLNIYNHVKTKYHKENSERERLSRRSVSEDHHKMSKTNLKMSANVDKETNYQDYQNKIKEKENILQQLNKNCEIHKSSIEYLTQIKITNEKEIENLKDKLINFNENDEENALKSKFSTIQAINQTIKDEILKIEQKIIKLKEDNLNNEKQNYQVMEDNLKLKSELSEFLQLFDMLKDDLNLKSDVNNFDEFEFELLNELKNLEQENRMLKDRFVSQLLS